MPNLVWAMSVAPFFIMNLTILSNVSAYWIAGANDPIRGACRSGMYDFYGIF